MSPICRSVTLEKKLLTFTSPTRVMEWKRLNPRDSCEHTPNIQITVVDGNTRSFTAGLLETFDTLENMANVIQMLDVRNDLTM